MEKNDMKAYNEKSLDKEVTYNFAEFTDDISPKVKTTHNLYYLEIEKKKRSIISINNHASEGNTVSLLAKKDPSKVENAPINNLAAERHVGLVQYELSIGGACNLTSVSNSIVKAKSIDLIEFKPDDEMNKFCSLVSQDVKLGSGMIHNKSWKKWNLAEGRCVEEKNKYTIL
ncbi:unnamed protein product [Lepeophtheirus salmonis]|uniref:(salmon louse) hypothetical protein n=1 Tax=Lepeophtheirus salmonis TaxID=72036 RepID=A0A7R8CXA5_LEPSM|nr:unnamed protein product [Lepeophtheirus salmonis]CAF2958948.1 unnamed protein product [Lepeophtheirus salmonis]